MSHEDDIATLMEADSTLMGTLTGGVYTSGEVGREGITRDTAAGAFGTGGYLKPCALVKQRGLVPDGQVTDLLEQVSSAAQVVEIYLYEDSGYSSIDTALNRLYGLLAGVALSGTFPLEWVNEINRERDEGALSGASMARQDWLVPVVRQA